MAREKIRGRDRFTASSFNFGASGFGVGFSVDDNAY
jgi:hypothetical protein